MSHNPVGLPENEKPFEQCSVSGRPVASVPISLSSVCVIDRVYRGHMRSMSQASVPLPPSS